MAHEVELKFIAPPGVWQRAMRLAWLKPLIRGKAKTRRLRSIYFDTRALTLQSNGMTLRIRSDGHGWVQTIKTFASGGVGVERREWEVPIASDRPNLKQLRHIGTSLQLKRKGNNALRRLFETRVLRRAIMLEVGGSEMELALDRGVIAASGRREPIHEIELELKKGRKSDLLKLGARLARSLSLDYGLWAKAERGYALRARTTNVPRMAEKIVLDPALPPWEAVRAISFSCLRHFAGNRNAVLKHNSEGVHQMRVGLRRLRVAISLFQKGQTRERARMEQELKWLIDRLTPVRDFDVFLQEDLIPRCDANPRNAGLRQLRTAALKRRREEILKATTIIKGPRARKLVLDMVLWLAEDKASGGKARSLMRLVRTRFRRLDHHIRKDIAALKQLNARQRHKLRIRVKMLRYMAEFFESFYAGEKTGARFRRFRKALKGLQDRLGALNDIEVHRILVSRLLKDKNWRSSDELFELGVIHQDEETRFHKLLKETIRTGKGYTRARRWY
jgi:inorganic triphosphatase YgiF